MSANALEHFGEFWDSAKQCWRVGKMVGSNFEALEATQERAVLWKVCEMKMANQKQAAEIQLLRGLAQRFVPKNEPLAVAEIDAMRGEA